MSREEGIKKVMGGGRHLVILGAGASIASCIHNPEKNGQELPSMLNLVDVVGLNDIVDDIPENLRDENFEVLYSKLHDDNPESERIKEIEHRVKEYFRTLKLPDTPTIYDYMLMALRSKDQIATFNWDPFLYLAYNRCSAFTKNLPYLCFLHGCAGLGYNPDMKRSGPAGMYGDKECTKYFAQTKLLYPVTNKDYSSDEFAKEQWKWATDIMGSKDTWRFTVFGYGAPETDVQAMSLLNDAWGMGADRNMEQVEMINIEDEDRCKRKWNGFIHSHHYDYGTSYFDSVLAHYPRRTCESYQHHYIPLSASEAFQESNPIPPDIKTLEELWEWHQPLIDAEEEYEQKEK